MSTGTMYLSSWKWSSSASGCKDNNRTSLVLAWQLFLVLVVSWTSAHNDPATENNIMSYATKKLDPKPFHKTHVFEDPKQYMHSIPRAWLISATPIHKYLPRFGKPLNNLTVSVGREAVFACIVENLGPYKVAWLRVDTQTILTISNHVITKNHRIAVTHSGHRAWSLHIRDTREADRGWYMCQVNTDPMSSITGFLEVVVPPDILDYPTSTDMIVSENSNVTLRCAATGTPEPTVTWRREAGGTITTSNGQEVPSIEGPELEITRVNRLHMGAYLCIASNGIPPSVSKRIVLIVHFPPMIRVENQLFGAYEGQTLVLECHSEGYPRPIMYWTKPNNETVTNDGFYKVETSVSGYETLMKLSIRSVRLQDYGPFFCLAENSLGRTDGKIKVYREYMTHVPRYADYIIPPTRESIVFAIGIKNIVKIRYNIKRLESWRLAVNERKQN
uniref:Ig-like domain-containing protein n=1 Tax=Trichogramma kaykai TaxID=54128 RepID=A0ABD2W5L6_9HYME